MQNPSQLSAFVGMNRIFGVAIFMFSKHTRVRFCALVVGVLIFFRERIENPAAYLVSIFNFWSKYQIFNLFGLSETYAGSSILCTYTLLRFSRGFDVVYLVILRLLLVLIGEFCFHATSLTNSSIIFMLGKYGLSLFKQFKL